MPENQPIEDFNYVNRELMPKISRTFDFTIRKLPEGLQKELIVAYALCRTIDCIEDSYIAPESKIELMNGLVSCFSNQDVSAASSLESKLTSVGGKKPGYQRLMRHYSRVVSASETLDKESVERISNCGRQMADGLSNPQIQRIVTLEDHYRYCHYAAAVVGYFITDEMLAKGYLTKEQLKRLMPSVHDNNPEVGINFAHDFALALQLTNNIRDLHEDYKNGIFRWPSSLLSSRDLAYEDIVRRGISGGKKEKALEILQLQIGDAERYFGSGVRWVDEIPFEAEGKEDGDFERIKHSWGDALALSAATLGKINSKTFFKHPESNRLTRKEVYKIDEIVSQRVAQRKNLCNLIEHLFEKTIDEKIED